MADNSSSSVASVAIVVIVVLALIALYFAFGRGDSGETIEFEVENPIEQRL